MNNRRNATDSKGGRATVRPSDFTNSPGNVPKTHGAVVAYVLDFGGKQWKYNQVMASGILANTNVNSGRHYKSPKVRGAYHPLLPTFRLPTPYRRGIARFWPKAKITFYRAGAVNPWLYSFAMEDSLNGNGVSWAYPGYDFNNGFLNLDPSLSNEAYTKAYADFNQSAMQLGESIGELGDTISMLIDLILSVFAAIRALQTRDYEYFVRDTWKRTLSGNRGLAPRLTPQQRIRVRRVESSWRKHLADGWAKKGEKASDGWLTYQYGILPLISDIHAGLELLEKGFQDTGALFRTEGIASQRFHALGYVTPTQYTAFGRDSVRTVLYGLVKSNFNAKLAQLGLANPAEIAWQLVPLSFVVDWFLPIGTWLAGLTAYLNVFFISGTETRMREVRTDGVNLEPWFGYGPAFGELPQGSLSFMAMDRRVLAVNPVPLPFLGSGISSLTRLASAVALITHRR